MVARILTRTCSVKSMKPSSKIIYHHYFIGKHYSFIPRLWPYSMNNFQHRSQISRKSSINRLGTIFSVVMVGVEDGACIESWRRWYEIGEEANQRRIQARDVHIRIQGQACQMQMNEEFRSRVLSRSASPHFYCRSLFCSFCKQSMKRVHPMKC